MAQLSETFPTLDCSQCIMTPKMVDVANHPNVTLYTYAEVENVEGYIGNFQVTVRKKARSVDEAKCTGCGVCSAKCPQKKIPNAFDRDLGTRPPSTPPSPRRYPTRRSSTGRTAPASRPANAASAPRSAAPAPSTTISRTS